MPWKNGLGTTTEIAVHPEGAGLDAFTWRLSAADLLASGPFSTFPGYDRTLVQIEGAPMTLSHGDLGEHRLRLLMPYRFAGEAATFGALDSPPARDFNVMVRRDRARADVGVHELAKGAVVHAGGEGETLAVYVLRGSVSVDASGETRALVANETLIATDAGRAVITAADQGAVVLVVTIGSLVQAAGAVLLDARPCQPGAKGRRGGARA
jgi:environmental stress-induced protein Ves